MKKISVFTFCFSNFGAILQAYALQEYLKSLNNDVEIVNLCTPTQLKNLKVLSKKPTGRNPFRRLKYWLNSILYYRQYNQMVERTQDFRKHHLQLSRLYSSASEILSNLPAADIYLTGSDQVFNPKSQRYQLFYLGFDKGMAKKIAYAPSFGISKFTDDMTERISSFVKDFDSLSCREKVGADYLSTIYGKPVPTVVDPVFLHDNEFWSKVSKKPTVKGGYIFYYDLHSSNLGLKLAKRIKKETSLPIVRISRVRSFSNGVDEQIRNAGPAEFLGLIENASYVVSDSFHATAFSIIFRKNFFAVNGRPEAFSRIDNLMNAMKLQGRIIDDRTLCDFNISNYSENLEADLVQFSQPSKSYLQTAIYD